jgi:hypothetical protein
MHNLPPTLIYGLNPKQTLCLPHGLAIAAGAASSLCNVLVR